MKTMKRNRRIVMAVLMAAMLLMLAVSAFAQVTATLDINTGTITTNLFNGANVIIGALLAVVMLMAGFRFGSQILDRLVKAINF